MDLVDEGRFNFFLRIYVNDTQLMERYLNAPQTCPEVSLPELIFEMENAWNHLEEMIPDSHMEAIYGLL